MVDEPNIGCRNPYSVNTWMHNECDDMSCNEIGFFTKARAHHKFSSLCRFILQNNLKVKLLVYIVYLPQLT